MGKKILATAICLMLLLLLLGNMPAMARGKTETDRYTAVTEDGVELAMKRYRPDQTAGFRRGAQPIIMLPGILSSMNEFDVRTPEGENYDITLPDPLAPWAKRDNYIQKDPMRYYSMAHYLWLQGYDVWMANYRGEGREPYLSGGATGYSLDDLGIYDMPAIVEKVYEVTHKHPIWLGHSMGSTMAFIYLQGAKYGGGDNPHVISDPDLVKERNNGDGPQAIRALVDLDGPECPWNAQAFDNAMVWMSMYWSVFIDVRPTLIAYGPAVTPVGSLLGQWMWDLMKQVGMPDFGPLNSIFAMNFQNLDPAVSLYGIKYCFDGISLRALAQYLDASAHGVFREDYLNGRTGLLEDFFPPDPAPGDGYYCYSSKENLAKVTIPAIVLADDRNDATNPADIQRFYDGKTRTSLDQFTRVPGTAHADLVLGLNCPTVTFPTIGKWLRDFMAKNRNH